MSDPAERPDDERLELGAEPPAEDARDDRPPAPDPAAEARQASEDAALEERFYSVGTIPSSPTMVLGASAPPPDARIWDETFYLTPPGGTDASDPDSARNRVSDLDQFVKSTLDLIEPFG